MKVIKTARFEAAAITLFITALETSGLYYKHVTIVIWRLNFKCVLALALALALASASASASASNSASASASASALALA
jgi:hypothetical protein